MTYTPGTERVRESYVVGMRQAFIASAGEHREEFNRWLSDHDHEVRSNVLEGVLTSLADQGWDVSIAGDGDTHPVDIFLMKP